MVPAFKKSSPQLKYLCCTRHTFQTGRLTHTHTHAAKLRPVFSASQFSRIKATYFPPLEKLAECCCSCATHCFSETLVTALQIATLSLTRVRCDRDSVCCGKLVGWSSEPFSRKFGIPLLPATFSADQVTTVDLIVRRRIELRLRFNPRANLGCPHSLLFIMCAGCSPWSRTSQSCPGVTFARTMLSVSRVPRKITGLLHFHRWLLEELVSGSCNFQRWNSAGLRQQQLRSQLCHTET